jgi:hypothetical protein
MNAGQLLRVDSVLGFLLLVPFFLIWTCVSQRSLR